MITPARYRYWHRLTIAAAVVVALFSACSPATATVSERGIAAPDSTGSDGQELTLAVVDGGQVTGKVITDHRGFAVYGVAGETADELVCLDECTTVWTPLAPRNAAVADELDVSQLTTLRRPDGSEQAVYAGVPLYTWTGDRQVGITGGAGVAGIWFALTETGGFFDS
jgi:predicted lipoprotein with Yx(FWY)xxD motif